MQDKDTYTKDELIEAIRLVLFTGTPEVYDNNVVLYPGYTLKRATEAFYKYCVTKTIDNVQLAGFQSQMLVDNQSTSQ